MEAWVVLAAGTVAAGWIGFSLAIGVNVFRHPDWDLRFHDLLEHALIKRRLEFSDFTESDLRVLSDLQQRERPQEPSTDPSAFIRTALLLAGNADPDEDLVGRLLARADTFLDESLLAQADAIRGIPFGRPLERAWRRQRSRSGLQVALAGLRWFAPLRGKHMLGRLAAWLSGAAAVSLLATLLWYLIVGAFEGEVSFDGAAATLGTIALLAGIIALVIMVFSESWRGIRLARSAWGGDSVRSAVLSAGLLLLVVLVIVPVTIAFSRSGVMADWTEWSLSAADDLIAEFGVGDAGENSAGLVGAFLFGGFFVVLAWPFIRASRRRLFRSSTRLFNASGAATALWFGFPFLVLGFTTAGLLPVHALFAWPVLIAVPVQVFAAGVAVMFSEHISRMRELRAADVRFPHGMTASFALSWCGALLLTIAITTVAGWMVPSLATETMQLGFVFTVGVWTTWCIYALIGLAVAGAVVWYRHVGRVDAAHRAWRMGVVSDS